VHLPPAGRFVRRVEGRVRSLHQPVKRRAVHGLWRRG
jgi:hypothetical protein